MEPEQLSPFYCKLIVITLFLQLPTNWLHLTLSTQAEISPRQPPPSTFIMEQPLEPSSSAAVILSYLPPSLPTAIHLSFSKHLAKDGEALHFVLQFVLCDEPSRALDTDVTSVRYVQDTTPILLSFGGLRGSSMQDLLPGRHQQPLQCHSARLTWTKAYSSLNATPGFMGRTLVSITSHGSWGRWRVKASLAGLQGLLGEGTVQRLSGPMLTETLSGTDLCKRSRLSYF